MLYDCRREFGSVAVAGLRVDVLQVGLHGSSCHEELFGDLGIGEPFGDQRDDALFRGGQAGPAMTGDERQIDGPVLPTLPVDCHVATIASAHNRGRWEPTSTSAR
jgi:hypothetical protein